MTTMLTMTTTTAPLTHLDLLEGEAIHILREAVAQCARPALLFSGGKDSAVLLHLAVKAFAPSPLPFPLLHIDTGHNYDSVIAFRNQRARETGAQLLVGHVEDAIRDGRVVLQHPLESRNRHQSVALMDAIRSHRFDALFGGARRDEEKARAKERVFSFRNEQGSWDPRGQRPELWSLYHARPLPGEHVRVFPISNWTELDVWRYIAREGLELPSLYFAHEREVIRRGALLAPVTDLTPPAAGERPERMSVRFRTVGDITCTAPVASTASTVEEIVIETLATAVSERGATRLDDQTSEASMELRKKEGYF